MSATNNSHARPLSPRKPGTRPFSLLRSNTSTDTSPAESKNSPTLVSPRKSYNGPFSFSRKLTSVTTPVTSPTSSRPSTPSPSDTVTDLQFRIESLETQLEAKSLEVKYANSKARQAEEGRRRLKDMGEKFWREEWGSMRDFMRAFSEEWDVAEIERRLVSEYGGLFVGGGDGIGVPTPTSSISSSSTPVRGEMPAFEHEQRRKED